MIEPIIKPVVTFTVQQAQPSFNGKYTLVAIHPNGTEKPGTEFDIDVKGFEKLYKKDTLQPEGDKVEGAQFKVKKNPKI